jgi:hypothetical protein
VKAAQGNAEATRTLELMNISASEFIKLPMDEKMTLVIDRLHGMSNATLRNALAREIWSKSAGEMMGMVAEGSAEIAKATADAEAWGTAINRVDAAKLEMANDAMKRAQEATKGVFTQIAIQLSPAVVALANHFADTKAEARGYRDEASKGAEVVAEAIGYVANVIQGLRFAWVGIKLVVAEVADVTVGVLATMAKVITESKIAQWAEYIPGPLGLAAKGFRMLGAASKETLAEMAISTGNVVTEIKEQLDAIALEGLPHDEIVARIRRVREEMEVEAKRIAKLRGEFNKDTGGELPKLRDDSKWKEDLAHRVAQIQIENSTELEMLQAKLVDKQNTLDLAAAQGLIGDEAWQAQSAMIFKQYEDAKTKILDDEVKKRWGISNIYRQLDLNSAGFFFSQIAGLMQSKNKTMFEIGKAGAIGETIIQTYRAAQGAYAALAPIPIIGPALGAAAAGAAILSGMARVSAIRSQQFGSGSGATPVYDASPSTGLPTAPTTPQQEYTPPEVPGLAAKQQEAQNVHITFVGGTDKSYTYQEVAEEIIPLLNEAAGNGLNITVSTVG